MDTRLPSQSLAEDMPFPLVVITPEHRKISWANSKAESWFGRSRRLMCGQGLSYLTPDADCFSEALDKVIETGAAVSTHGKTIRTESGNGLLCNLTAFPFDEGIALLIRPVDKRGMPEVITDPVSALGRMLAHELKNPLAGIKGAAQLLAMEVTSTDGNELIDLISTEIDRIRRLADRMEAFGDMNSVNKEPVNIHSILRQAMLLAQSGGKNGVEFIEEYDPSLPFVYGDRDALMQVALNLLVNATEALSTSGKGDTIRLRTSYRSGIRHHDTTAKKGLRALPIEIRIIDNGPGIPEHIRGQMFQPFVTDKPAGRGLGLALVSKIITAHDGEITVTSRPGETAFSLLLPAYIDEESA